MACVVWSSVIMTMMLGRLVRPSLHPARAASVSGTAA